MLLNKNIGPPAASLIPHQRLLFLFLTVVAGLLVLLPFHDFQYFLAQGDHGRDLYCFKKTMEGALPYRDYSWLFGPLMPYYYSLFYHLFGVSIQSVLLGQNLIILLAGVFIFLICSVFISSSMAFMCALWYWAFRDVEFFYTYNHIGGLLTLLAAIYFSFRYIDKNRRFYVCGGFASLLLLMLIRLNMGVAALIPFFVTLCMTDVLKKDPHAPRKRRLYFCISLGILAAAGLIYWLLLHSLPDYAIRQSFPYGKSQRTDYTGNVWSSVRLLWYIGALYFTATWPQRIFGILLIFSALQTVFLVVSKRLSQTHKTNILLAAVALGLFTLFSLHEFFASGVFYRLYWTIPLVLIGIFLLVGTATAPLSSPVVKTLILWTFFLPPFFRIENQSSFIQSLKNPYHMLHIGKNRIYTAQSPLWFNTVTQAARFLISHVPKHEKILVMPLDPLYLFLSERDSATRQLVFFDHINIPPKQEKEIIAELERQNVQWVVISNRAHSKEQGLGVLGQTYCLLITDYLEHHFQIAAEFGEWSHPDPGWIENHGVRVLKRAVK
ncbi:MAG: hypothetical protein A3D87_05165 [Omnitrophica WOR_2 bacterium RIFCSPHIGHO2_02_FULL_50_17]|nr:MAG: hypothetical protein A3D87_05165 [Omnitrophica WOR_2 bacterium RIFCSPHIGHO2_02_FULL_50_17]